jgi:hypothetical protein
MTQYALIVAEAEWWKGYRLVNLLLRAGIPVFWLLDEATGAPGADGREVALPRGSFLIGDGRLEDRNRAQDTAVADLAGRLGVQLRQYGRVTAPALLRLRASRVAVYGGGGAPFHHLFVLRSLGFVADPIMPEQIRSGALGAYVALAVPGGGWRAMEGQLCPLAGEGCRAVAEFVRRGGLYLGSCAGSYDAALVPETFHQRCPEQREMQLINAEVWNSGDPAWGGLESPGVGVVEVEGTRPDHPILFNLPPRFRMTHYNGPIFAPVTGRVPGASLAEGLVRFTGPTDRFTAAEHFLAPSAAGAERQPTLLERAAQQGLFSVVCGRLDAGGVVLYGSHPEFGQDLSLIGAQNGLEDSALLLANALFWHAAIEERDAGQDAPEPGWPDLWAQPASACLMAPRRRQARLKRVMDELSGLTGEAHRPPWWLDQRYSMSVFGRAPAEIWRSECGRMSSLTGRLGDDLDRLGRLMDDADAARAGAAPSRALAWAVRDCSYRRDPAWEQDGGYQGADALLAEAIEMLEQALHLRDSPAQAPPQNAYEDAGSNPFHLAVGSYLAASGLLSAAVLLIRSAAMSLEWVLLPQVG